MAQAIRFLLTNFTLTFLGLGVLAAAVSAWRKGGAHGPEAAIAFFCLFAIGLTFFYNFVMHVFFGATAASFIGWANSPFQTEVGWASLGFAAVGLLAFRGGSEMRLAAVLGPACFLWGAAVGHVQQMMVAHNFAPGNAGAIFWTDILIPLLGFALLWFRYRRGGAAEASPV